MPISATCPNCGKSGTVPDEALGKKCKCKACRTVFLVEKERSSPASRVSSFASHQQVTNDTKVAVNDPQGRLREMLRDPPQTVAANPDLAGQLASIADRIDQYEFLSPYFFHPLSDVRRTAAELSVSIDCGGVDYFLSLALADRDPVVSENAALCLWQRDGGPRYAANFMANEMVSPAAGIGARTAKVALQLLLDRALNNEAREELREYLAARGGDL